MSGISDLGGPRPIPRGGFRSGLALSLVILRGRLENTSAWVNDTDPTCGAYQLADLRGDRCRLIVAQADGEWPEQCAGLVELIGAAAKGWAKQSPAERSEAIERLRRLVVAWLVECER